MAGIALAAMCFASSSFCQTTDRDQALNLFRQERWSDAASAFEALEKQQPGQTDALLYRGKCLVNLKQFKDAGAALQAYIASHPQSDDAMYLLAFVLFRQDKPKESLQLFTDAAKLKTPNLDALKIVSFDYVLLKDYVDAGHYLEIVLQMDPNNLEARYYLGRVRYQQNRLDDAIAAFREVLGRDPGNVKAEDNLGLCLEGKNQVDQAIEAYQKAIASDESSLVHTEQPYLNLGILQAKTQQRPRGFAAAGQSAEDRPKIRRGSLSVGEVSVQLEPGRGRPARGRNSTAAQSQRCSFALFAGPHLSHPGEKRFVGAAVQAHRGPVAFS